MNTDISGPNEPLLLYVTDAYCGWCWGFVPKLRAFYEAHRDTVSFRVVSGGLFAGERRRPIREYGHIAEANERITRQTGMEFGEPYQRLLREGSFVLDSEAAAAGFAALRSQAPERAIELFHAGRAAFYIQGRSLSEPGTFAQIAEDFGLDPLEVTRFMQGKEGVEAAQTDFALTATLGVNRYPTLLLVKDGQAHGLPGIGAPVEALSERLRDLLPL